MLYNVTWRGSVIDKDKQIAELKAELDRKTKALEKYGKHKLNCNIYIRSHDQCSCGFKQALKGE